jgi:hypothetical protein
MSAQNTAEFLQETLGGAPEAYVYANKGSHWSFIFSLLMGPAGGMMLNKSSGILVLQGGKLHHFAKITGDFKKGTFAAEKVFSLDLAQIEKAKNLKIGVVDYLTLTQRNGEKVTVQINRFMKIWNKDQAAHADKIKKAVGA